jgi:hypothetical protein
MTPINHAWLRRASYAFSLAILAGTIWFVWNHKFASAFPAATPNDNSKAVASTVEATGTALLQVIFYTSGLSFGLAALVAFALKRQGVGAWLRAFNIVLLSVFSYLLVRCVLYAYEASAIVVVQIDLGRIYLTIISPIVEKQVQALLFLTVVALLIAAANLFAENP